MRPVPRLFRAAVVACAAMVSSLSFAGVTIDVNQVGSDVVATIAGSFDYSGINTYTTGSGNLPSFIGPNDGNFGFGNTVGSTAWIGWSIYQDNYPPAYAAPFFGNGSNAGNGIYLSNTTSGVGTLYLQANPASSPGANEARFRLPTSYIAGGPISGSETWTNKSYTDLGLASTGTWSWTAENGQTVVFRINAVPEPAVCAGGVVAALTLGAWIRRRTAKKA